MGSNSRAAAAGSAACSVERTRLGSELKVSLVSLAGVVSSWCRVKQNPRVSGCCCYTRFELETEFCLCLTSESQREGAAAVAAEKEAGKRISHEFYFTSSSSRLNIYFSINLFVNHLWKPSVTKPFSKFL